MSVEALQREKSSFRRVDEQMDGSRGDIGDRLGGWEVVLKQCSGEDNQYGPSSQWKLGLAKGPAQKKYTVTRERESVRQAAN
ncbi:MAG: hypothetical protein Q9218_001472 [Villophora microphyllina]